MKYRFSEAYPVTYSQYRDAHTGHILTAHDGETYELEPVVEGLPVPPEDGRWTEAPEDVPAPPATAPAPAPAPPAPAPADAPETTDGGEG